MSSSGCSISLTQGGSTEADPATRRRVMGERTSGKQLVSLEEVVLVKAFELAAPQSMLGV